MVPYASIFFAKLIYPLVSEVNPGGAVVIQWKETAWDEWLGEINDQPSTEIRLAWETLAVVIYDINVTDMAEDLDSPFSIQELPG